MSDYIKREDAIEVFAEHLWEHGLDLDSCRYIAKKQLESAPCVDVVEVKGKTMSDYITKDEVLTLLNPNDTRISEPYIALVREEIKLRPSADVVEVRHGRWIEREDGINCYQCSMCHWLVGDLEAKAYVYCPNCGARMDGEEE